MAEDLGVQYVLEGSVQKSGDRLRITTQLIDALTGHHLCSDVYNREMKALFELHDEITKKIVVLLHVGLTSGEDARVSAKSTDNLEAFKHFKKGNERSFKLNKADNTKAREHSAPGPQHPACSLFWAGFTQMQPIEMTYP